jgi:hypothetical protein
MKKLIVKSFNRFQEELIINSEVHSLLHDMLETVSLYHLQNDFYRLKENFCLIELFNKKLLKRIANVESEFELTKKELFHIKDEASIVREKFVNQIGSFLLENRLNAKLKNRIIELEDYLSRLPKPLEEEAVEEETSEKKFDETITGTVDSEKKPELLSSLPTIDPVLPSSPAPFTDSVRKASTSEVLIKKKAIKNPLPLLLLEETPLLHIFSFLQTVEVLNYAQVCRYVYQRMDRIFGIDSSTVKPDWSTPPLPPSQQQLPQILPSSFQPSQHSVSSPSVNSPSSSFTSTTVENVSSGLSSLFSSAGNKPKTSDSLATDSSSTGGEIKLTREIVDELTKRLTAQQMKVILGIAEKMKKQSSLIDSLNVEKDDLSARLQNTESVKDFLIEKLKTAELAIKSMMNETSTLKKQSASDSEVDLFRCFFLVSFSLLLWKVDYFLS